ncbi:phage tail sheath subtilisin-like domain-containing protein, partial [Escherichia coli]
IVSVSVPSAKIIAYAKSINQYPGLGANWTAEVTSASSGLAATLTVGKIVTDSGVLLTEPETATEQMTSVEFQAALKTYGMPGI